MDAPPLPKQEEEKNRSEGKSCAILAVVGQLAQMDVFSQQAVWLLNLNLVWGNQARGVSHRCHPKGTLWMDEILCHSETRGSHCLLILTWEPSGFLGGAKWIQCMPSMTTQTNNLPTGDGFCPSSVSHRHLLDLYTHTAVPSRPLLLEPARETVDGCGMHFASHKMSRSPLFFSSLF